MVPQEPFGLRVETGRGLVQEKDLGVVDQGPGDDQPPLHADGEFSGKIFLPFSEGHERQELVDARVKRRRLHPMHLGVEDEVFPRGEVPVEVVFLRDDADQGANSGAFFDHIVAADGS